MNTKLRGHDVMEARSFWYDHEHDWFSWYFVETISGIGFCWDIDAEEPANLFSLLPNNDIIGCDHPLVPGIHI